MVLICSQGVVSYYIALTSLLYNLCLFDVLGGKMCSWSQTDLASSPKSLTMQTWSRNLSELLLYRWTNTYVSNLLLKVKAIINPHHSSEHQRIGSQQIMAAIIKMICLCLSPSFDCWLLEGDPATLLTLVAVWVPSSDRLSSF